MSLNGLVHQLLEGQPRSMRAQIFKFFGCRGWCSQQIFKFCKFLGEKFAHASELCERAFEPCLRLLRRRLSLWRTRHHINRPDLYQRCANGCTCLRLLIDKGVGPVGVHLNRS
jgi:hypothetical protein